ASDYNGEAIRCYGESNGALSAVVRDGNDSVATPAYYEWYKNEADLMAGPTATLVEGLDASTYKVRITYNTHCHAEASFVLEAPKPLAADVLIASNYNGFPVSCHDATDGELQAIASGGTGSVYSFTWQDGTRSETLSDLGAGTYAVIVRDMNGCESLAE